MLLAFRTPLFPYIFMLMQSHTCESWRKYLSRSDYNVAAPKHTFPKSLADYNVYEKYIKFLSIFVFFFRLCSHTLYFFGFKVIVSTLAVISNRCTWRITSSDHLFIYIFAWTLGRRRHLSLQDVGCWVKIKFNMIHVLMWECKIIMCWCVVYQIIKQFSAFNLTENYFFMVWLLLGTLAGKVVGISHTLRMSSSLEICWHVNLLHFSFFLSFFGTLGNVRKFKKHTHFFWAEILFLLR